MIPTKQGRIAIGIIILLLFSFLIIRGLVSDEQPQETHSLKIPAKILRADTQKVKHVKPIVLKEIPTVPRKVLIQRGRDTSGRKLAEGRKINRGTRVDFARKIIDIQTIDIRGTTAVASYDIEPSLIREIIVNDTGATNIIYKTPEELAKEQRKQRRKERWQRAKDIATGVGIGTAVVAAVKVLVSILG